MDLIVHDTLIKMTCDYFDTNTIETAKRTLFQGNAVADASLGVPLYRNKGQFNRENNIFCLFCLRQDWLRLRSSVVGRKMWDTSLGQVYQHVTSGLPTDIKPAVRGFFFNL